MRWKMVISLLLQPCLVRALLAPSLPFPARTLNQSISRFPFPLPFRLSSNRGHHLPKQNICQASMSLVSDVPVHVMVSRFLGYCIVGGSFFLQMPQLLRILKNRSVMGISSLSRYSEVPINSSAVIYHVLKGLPFASYGENVVILLQNIACVILMWIYRVPRVQKREILLVLALFGGICSAELALPPSYLPLLIYVNIPLVLGTTLPQIVENFRQGHTGQLAIMTCFLKLCGCCVRLATTLVLVGPDPGLLASYSAGATLNSILIVQGLVYREATARALSTRMEGKES